MAIKIQKRAVERWLLGRVGVQLTWTGFMTHIWVQTNRLGNNMVRVVKGAL